MANVDYKVLGQDTIFLGRTYGEWISEFIGWLFSVDPDKNNDGNVVFLRPFPSSPDPNYYGRIEPNLMVGHDKLQIFTDQAILIPVLLSYWASNDPNETETMLREKVRMDMINGDYPPRADQITIDGESIKLEGDDTISNHLIESPLFTLMVPDDEYGKSMKDYMDYPLNSGVNQSVGTGYFFLITFLREGLFTIHSYARGHRTEKGEYNEEFLYQVEVTDANKRPLPPQRGVIPLVATNFVLTKLKEKDKNGEFESKDYERLKRVINYSRQKNEIAVWSESMLLHGLKTLKPDEMKALSEGLTKLKKLKPDEMKSFLVNLKTIKPDDMKSILGELLTLKA